MTEAPSGQVRKLSDVWPKFLEGHLKLLLDSNKPDGFNRVQDHMLMNLISAVIHESDTDRLRRLSKEELLDEVKREHKIQFQGDTAYFNLRAMYKKAFNEKELLRNTKRQYEWSVTADHIKSLIFRAATAVVIAIVVLCTGYFAKILDIPLPLLRGL